jgi:hypothetical protein
MGGVGTFLWVFPCFFLAERKYILQSQYESQSNDMTQKTLADLTQYVSDANRFDELNRRFVYEFVIVKTHSFILHKE